jgi:hypothetical protein
MTPWTCDQLKCTMVPDVNSLLWQYSLKFLDIHSALIRDQTERLSLQSIVPLLSILSKLASSDKDFRMSLRRHLFLEGDSRKGFKKKRGQQHALLSILDSTDETAKYVCMSFLLILFRGHLQFMARYVSFGYLSLVTCQPEAYSHLIQAKASSTNDEEDESMTSTDDSAKKAKSEAAFNMSEDEKEREADRLIHLLNRLHQTGVVRVPPPEEIEDLD